MIRLIIRHEPLSAAIRVVLEINGANVVSASSEEDVRSGDLVVTTTMDTPFTACRALVGRGARVVVLTPSWQKREADRYADAGAVSYLEMTADSEAFIDALALDVSPCAAKSPAP
jgi:hypothetical protein